MVEKNLRQPKPNQEGFTLIEMLISVAVVAILASLIIGSVSKIKQSAQRSACAGNLRQIGVAAQQYAADNNGYFPYTYDLVLGVNDPGGLISYLGDYVSNDYRLFYCPDAIHCQPGPGVPAYTYAYQKNLPATSRFYLMGYFWTYSISYGQWDAAKPQKTAGLGSRVLAMCPNMGGGNVHNRLYNVLRADGRIDIRKPSSDGILLQHVNQQTLLLSPLYDK